MEASHGHPVDAAMAMHYEVRSSGSNEEDPHEGGEAHVIKISRLVVAGELIKNLSGEILSGDCVSMPTGYSACIKAKIPKSRESKEIVQFVGRSCASHDTESEAIEKAAEDLINCLQTEFAFEINDVNWKTCKKLEASVDKLEKKVASLKKLVDSLVDGWAYSLQFADILCSTTNAMYLSASSEISFAGFEGGGVVISNTIRLKNLAKFAWMEGTKAMRRVLRVGV